MLILLYFDGSSLARREFLRRFSVNNGMHFPKLFGTKNSYRRLKSPAVQCSIQKMLGTLKQISITNLAL